MSWIPSACVDGAEKLALLMRIKPQTPSKKYYVELQKQMLHGSKLTRLVEVYAETEWGAKQAAHKEHAGFDPRLTSAIEFSKLS